MARPALHRLLDENLRRAPEYRGGLTNHLPMALHALGTMGADEATLSRFAAAYLQRTQLPLADAAAASPGRALRLGDFDAFPAWRSHFEARIAAVGPRAALVEALPGLWPGVAAAAFHGPIRVAHAWESRHEGELAVALAYWAARWQVVQGSPNPSPDLEVEGWLAMAEEMAGSWRSDRHLISQRMDDASRSPDFLALAGRLQPTGDALARASRRAARLYARTGNFTILHVVTGTRAVLRLSALSAPPWQVWPALAAAVVASEIDARPRPQVPERSWDEVKAAARSSMDDHVVKLVHACIDLAGTQGDADFLRAACRALG